jgi:large subunit ribosomal protein L1
VLPRGTGKTVRVAVFTQGANAEAARTAGADIVGFDDLAEKIKGGFMDFDVVIASPDAMKVVGRWARCSAPAASCPTRRSGTVTRTSRKREEREGRPGAVPRRQGGHRAMHDRPRLVRRRSLAENFEALLGAINKAKPASTKGIYLKKSRSRARWGVGIRIDQGSLGVDTAQAAH